MKHYKEDGFSNVHEMGSGSYLKVSQSNYGLISKQKKQTHTRSPAKSAQGNYSKDARLLHHMSNNNRDSIKFEPKLGV